MQSGLFLMPLEMHTLLAVVKTKIPVILSTTSASLVPPSLLDALQQNWNTTAVPLSAAAVRLGKQLIETSFQEHSLDDQPCVSTMDPATATSILEAAVEGLCAHMGASYKKVLAELDDVVYFGSRPCREWLQTIQQHGVNTIKV